ncbi:MAG: hypothetical protein U9Q71_01320, partial [Pseudomonadota bacterium]|nr:hypothetical protein [Pseudomonadota bacterium]
ALLDQLQSARVVGVQMEHWQEGGFTGGKLNGAIDLVATNSNGREALLDIKWGAFKYRRRSLTESSYLQLATYAEMRRQATGRWPALGYFVIEDARLLALDTHYFPQAEVYAPENGESVAEYWQRFQCTWRWRREQLDGGLIEAPITGTEPSDTLPRPPGEKGLPLPDHYDSFNDYAVLTGWKEDA